MGLASDIPVFLLSLLIWLADSFFLLFPSLANDEKRKDGFLMNDVYGPLIGIKKHGGFFDGVLVTLMLFPMAMLVFVPYAIAQDVVTACAFVTSGFLPVIGIYMAITGFLPGYAPVAFAVLSIVFGVCGGVLRVDVGDDSSAPLVFLAWQTVWSLVFAYYARRMIVTMSKIPSVLKVQSIKLERFDANGKVWPAGKDRPTGAEIPPELERRAAAELDALSYVPAWAHALVGTLLTAAGAYALVETPPTAYDADLVLYGMIGEMVLWLAATILVTSACVKDKDKFLRMPTDNVAPLFLYNTMS